MHLDAKRARLVRWLTEVVVAALVVVGIYFARSTVLLFSVEQSVQAIPTEMETFHDP